MIWYTSLILLFRVIFTGNAAWENYVITNYQSLHIFLEICQTAPWNSYMIYHATDNPKHFLHSLEQCAKFKNKVEVCGVKTHLILSFWLSAWPAWSQKKQCNAKQKNIDEVAAAAAPESSSSSGGRRRRRLFSLLSSRCVWWAVEPTLQIIQEPSQNFTSIISRVMGWLH